MDSADPYIFHVYNRHLRIIIYVFAIVFTDVSTEYISNFEISDADTAFLKLRFADLERSMQTLFQSISNGLTWGDVADKMHNLSWVWGYLFVVYVTWMVRCDTEYVVRLVDCSLFIWFSAKRLNCAMHEVYVPSRLCNNHFTSIIPFGKDRWQATPISRGLSSPLTNRHRTWKWPSPDLPDLLRLQLEACRAG